MSLQTWKQNANGIPPLSHRDAHGAGQEWTEEVLAYGDDGIGCIKLTSHDGSITRTYTTVTRFSATGSEMTIFKGLSDYYRDSYYSHQPYR